MRKTQAHCINIAVSHYPTQNHSLAHARVRTFHTEANASSHRTCNWVKLSSISERSDLEGLSEGLDADGTLAIQGKNECFCTNLAITRSCLLWDSSGLYWEKEAPAASLSTKTKNRKPQNKGPNKRTPKVAVSNSKLEITLKTYGPTCYHLPVLRG